MLKISYAIDSEWLKKFKEEENLDNFNRLISHDMQGNLVFECESMSTKGSIISPDTFWIWFNFFLDDIDKSNEPLEYNGDIDGVSLNILIKNNILQLVDWNDNVIFQTTTSKQEIQNQLHVMISKIISEITEANDKILQIDKYKDYFDSFRKK